MNTQHQGHSQDAATQGEAGSEDTRDAHAALRDAAADADVPTIDPSRVEALLAHVAAGDLDIAAVAQELGISFVAMSNWMNEPRNAQMLENMLRLQDYGTQSFLNRMAKPAIAQLVHISRDDSKPDVARKACVDLLKVSPGSLRALNAARVHAISEKARVAGEKTVREDGATKPSKCEVVKTAGPTGFAFKRSVVDVTQDEMRSMLAQFAEREQPPRPPAPSKRAAHASPCAITLRREPIPPRQDLGTEAARSKVNTS